MFGKKKSMPEPRRRPAERQVTPATSVFSYYSGEPARQDAMPVRKTRAPLTRGQKLTAVYGSIAVFLLVCLFCTTLATRPAVSFVGMAGSPYRPTAAYEDAAAKALSAELSSRSKFTINTAVIEQAMLKEFPELSAVHVSLPIVGRRPNLILAARHPSVILKTTAKSLVLDTTGRVITESSSLEESVREALPSVEDSSTVPLKIGDQAVTSETIAFIRLAVAQLQAKKIETDRLALPAVANELDIYVKGQGYYVKCDVSGDARQQIGSYLAVRDRGVIPAEYMDVRVEEKVFYK